MTWVFSLQYWKAYGVTCRPYLFFVSGAAGLMGISLIPSPEWGRLSFAFLAFFLTYGLGQALTDVDQIDTDSISSPYRPLTKGIISRRQVFWTSLTGLFLCALILGIQNHWIILFSVFLILGLKTYTYFKRRWWGGPFWNAWIVAGLMILGRLCEKNVSPSQVFRERVTWAAAASIFGGYAVFVALGYFKDISADSATGYRTMPVVFGWKRGVLGSTVFWIIGALGSVFFFAWTQDLVDHDVISLIGSGIAISGWVLSACAHFQIWKISDKTEVLTHPAIENTVRGFILLALGQAVWLHSELLAIAAIFYISFEFVLRVRPEKTQI